MNRVTQPTAVDLPLALARFAHLERYLLQVNLENLGLEKRFTCDGKANEVVGQLHGEIWMRMCMFRANTDRLAVVAILRLCTIASTCLVNMAGRSRVVAVASGVPDW
jgi:hypothetical protein